MKGNRFFNLVKLLILLAGCVIDAFLVFKGFYTYAVLIFILLACLAYSIYQQIHFLSQQVVEFSEAVKYHDFTRRFVVKNAKSTEGRLFTSFNQINDTYKEISMDKEIQHQYLDRVINMLNSAIIFYQLDNGKVMWVNDAFKQLFHMPHLGNISALKKKHEELYEKTMRLDVGQQQMESVQSKKGKIKLLIQSSSFETQDAVFRIVVYQNINEAMDETETKAWQKLLRVLTHEIMNSIAPISSLAETLNGRLNHFRGQEDIEDLKVGISTIQRRSQGLLHFAKSYRMINKVDEPLLVPISAAQLFEHIYQLLEPTILQKNVDVDIILKNTRLVLHADVNLIEQVIINLMLNAIDAVKLNDNPYISLSAIEADGKIQVRIEDNGIGIPSDLQEQIFTPFFTTKKTGTGVGLTLSKQIMLLHKGTIFVNSEEGKGSVFILQF
ncbi:MULTISPECIES: sensor histidine kinase [Sphingobacterium]|uniref:sensor histidine kinase n=1 Tax=Sphingobacterium TaxID=28453 RepID=UPI00038A51FD|nr:MULTISPECIES: HAMP domain-containing sensor histidine kinase [Sphingobacterium]KKX49247.1 histidine kinase [Sphingobacterium sp. IITKGP-BTPF85]MCW2261162.1 nitrogen fixation/metabolism regulation signal transduction histidine kinase [Sphingobacterium kitahiroshimense]NJI75958.1 HAMP domain-containing histidine kinase [Sphingobacterium sp. B16(2022)]TCR02565.1 histidine kinase/DNA gyrase B/HSP90-like ATPase [Sphingobacterium sp. JUb78]